MSVYSNCIYSPFALVIVVVETPSIVSYFVEHFWSFIINKLIQWFDLLCKMRRAEHSQGVPLSLRVSNNSVHRTFKYSIAKYLQETSSRNRLHDCLHQEQTEPHHHGIPLSSLCMTTAFLNFFIIYV